MRATIESGEIDRHWEETAGQASESILQTLQLTGTVSIRTLCDEQKMSSAPIGYLPDGRAVYWLCSDPTALYMAQSAAVEHVNTAASQALTRTTERYAARIQKNFSQLNGALGAFRPPAYGTFVCFGAAVILRKTAFENA